MKQYNLTRRNFIGGAAAAAACTMLPLSYQCTNSKDTTTSGLNSKFGGVQIGTITYSFNDVTSTAENVLEACINSGVSSIELMSDPIERFAGCPAGPPMPTMAEIMKMTDEERAALMKSMMTPNPEQVAWRTSVSMSRFEELRKMYNDAGVTIHIAKFSPANWSDAEIDYAFNAAKALGAVGVTEELNEAAVKRLAPFAEKHGMWAIFHNHGQFGQDGFSADPMLAVSPAVKLNFDCGHYFGSTGLNPVDFIEKYSDRIISLHLKDKTGPNTDPRDTNQVWGQGETPLAEILTLVKTKYPAVFCDIELEYPVPAWSNSIKEVKNCVAYARQILI